MTEQEREAWNAAVKSGDKETIDRLRNFHLTRIHEHIMTDDKYQERTR